MQLITIVVLMDDKCTIPVGLLNTPIQAVQRQRPTLQTTNETYGACDHDVAPQHIVPSVTIRIDESDGGDQNIDWYGGQVYVGLKCAIFEPSSGPRHAAELCQKIDREGIDKDKHHLALLSDGGPDHNPVNIQVQMALIAVFLKLNLDSLLAVRTPPYLSVINPVERFMSIASSSLSSVCLCQNQLPPEEQKIVSKLLTKVQWREAQAKENFKKPEDRKNIQELAKKSVSSAMDVLEQRFSSIIYDEKRVIVEKSVEDDDIDELLSNLNKIVPDFDFKKKNLSKAEVMKLPQMKEFMEKHCNSMQYSFQIMKCDDIDCKFHKPINDLEQFKRRSLVSCP